MGIKSVNDNKKEHTDLLLKLKKWYREKTIYWLLILLFLLAVSVTVILKLWISSLVLVIASLAICVLVFYIIKHHIKEAREEINRMHELIEKKESYISDF